MSGFGRRSGSGDEVKEDLFILSHTDGPMPDPIVHHKCVCVCVCVYLLGF